MKFRKRHKNRLIAGIVTSLNDTTVARVTYEKYVTQIPDELAYEIY